MMNCEKCNHEIEEPFEFSSENDLIYVKRAISAINNYNDKVISIEKNKGYYPIDVTQETEVVNSKGDFEKYCKSFDDISIFGWRVSLKNTPDESFFNRFIKNVKQNPEHFHRNQKLHRGHLLASFFRNYLLPEYLDEEAKIKNKIDYFFGKGNKLNIRYQTAESNCNSKNFNGQYYFELKIEEFLKTHPSNEVYFEVYDISLSDKCLEDLAHLSKSLGRILNIEFLSDSRRGDRTLIFIPNRC